MSIADDLHALTLSLAIERVDQFKGDFTLWWRPVVDEGREKHRVITAWLRDRFHGKRILEVGYPWGGRVFPGSTVMDLYDDRPGVDLKVDACKMEGVSDDSFDLICCMSVLEHIPKFWLAAAEIQRVLAPGGVAFIGIPSVWPYHPGGTFQGKDYHYGGDYWRTNHAGIVSLFDRLAEIAVWYVPAAPPGDDPRSGWGVAYLGTKR